MKSSLFILLSVFLFSLFLSSCTSSESPAILIEDNSFRQVECEDIFPLEELRNVCSLTEEKASKYEERGYSSTKQVGDRCQIGLFSNEQFNFYWTGSLLDPKAQFQRWEEQARQRGATSTATPSL